jgi:hypothetical protein
MICPQCRIEYRAGFSMCADCEIPLVGSVEDIPTARPVRSAGVENRSATAGAPPRAARDGSAGFAQLAEVHRDEDLVAVLERLEVAGVPYVVLAGTALSVWDGDGLEGDGQPDLWRARILVPEGRWSAADEALAGLEVEAPAAPPTPRG